MSYFNQAQALLDNSEEKLKTISKHYKTSLESKDISTTLLIEIKNFFENLRSALDFTAHGLFESYGNSKKSKPKIYFPYASENQSLSQFRKKKGIETCIPGLSTSRPDIVIKLESYQWFYSTKNDWLLKFMKLNNENKHEKLSPQVQTETREMNITSRGVGIRMTGGAQIKMGKGTQIKMGDMTIPGGQSFSSNNPPITYGEGKKEITIWISFNFKEFDLPVIPFLKSCLQGVTRILNELSVL